MSENGHNDDSPKLPALPAGAALSLDDLLWQLMSEKPKEPEYSLPVGDLDKNKDDQYAALRLVWCKLMETRTRYEHSRLSVREEWEADSLTFLEAGLHFSEAAAGAAVCGAALIGIFTAKQKEVEAEFREVLDIWLEQRRVLYETGSVEKSLKALDDRMHKAGLLFEGVNKSLKWEAFNIREFLTWAERLGVGQNVTPKSPVDRFKEAVENTSMADTKAYAHHTYGSFVDNYRLSRLWQTACESWKGGKHVIRAVREFQISSNKHRPSYLGPMPHQELLKERPLAANFGHEGVTQSFLDEEYLSVRTALRKQVGRAKIRAATIVAANGFWAFNAWMFIENVAAAYQGDTAYLPWVIANIWSLNRSLGPIRDISHTLRTHDFPVIESTRAQLTAAKARLQDIMEEKQKKEADVKPDEVKADDAKADELKADELPPPPPPDDSHPPGPV
ncbi:MAG TPA: hypothetical protein PLO23_01705 [Alphaproteobacteria bacterium]|nr:hypothetical protein [Alphaproteobacteria bacterium]